MAEQAISSTDAAGQANEMPRDTGPMLVSCSDAQLWVVGAVVSGRCIHCSQVSSHTNCSFSDCRKLTRMCLAEGTTAIEEAVDRCSQQVKLARVRHLAESWADRSIDVVGDAQTAEKRRIAAPGSAHTGWAGERRYAQRRRKVLAEVKFATLLPNPVRD